MSRRGAARLAWALVILTAVVQSATVLFLPEGMPGGPIMEVLASIIFLAFGVPVDPVHLLVAFGVATTFGSLPLTPGGLGVFEATMLGTLTLLGVGYEFGEPAELVHDSAFGACGGGVAFRLVGRM
jgi:hypothetical protein